MSSALQRWFEARWYGGVMPELPLRLLAGLFGAVVGLRRTAYRRGWRRSTRLPLPVIVVGNLAIGGAGKTPMTIALVDALRARGWRPGVISRGHGGIERGPLRLPPDADPARFGDEPCLIAKRTGAPVAIARERAAAGRLLSSSGDVDVLIADDGLQHYALQRDIEVLLIDGRRRFGNGRLLPAGPLREPVSRADACTLQVVNGGDAAAGQWAMRLQIDTAVPLTGDSPPRPLVGFAGQTVHAIAGIADPARFFAALQAAGLDVVSRPFIDHHAFVADDLAFDDGRPLLMTEKDAVKCASFARPNWHAVPARAVLPDAFFDTLAAALAALPSR